MAYNTRKSNTNKRVCPEPEPVNSDAHILHPKKLKMGQYKKKQNDLNFVCNKDVTMQENSNNEAHTSINRNKRHMDMINENNPTSNKGYFLRYKKKSGEVSQKYNKRGSKYKRRRYYVVSDSESAEEYYETSNIATNNFIKKSWRKHRGRDDNVQNFNYHITKMIESLKNKFGTFKSQINHLQMKYTAEKTVTFQDAGNLFFIVNCIINKLKEELCEEQQNLMNLYINCSTRHTCGYNASNKHSGQCVNNNASDRHCQEYIDNTNLQTESDQSVESGSDVESFPANTSKKQSVKANESLSMNVQDKSKDALVMEKVNNSKKKLPEKIIYATSNASQKENNVTLQCNQNVMSTLDKLKEINVLKVSRKDSRSSCDHIASNVQCNEHIDKNYLTTQNEQVIQPRHSIESSKQMSETNESLQRKVPENKKEQRRFQNVVIDLDETVHVEDSVSRVTLDKGSNNQIEPFTNCRSDSEETVIISRDNYIQLRS